MKDWAEKGWEEELLEQEVSLESQDHPVNSLAEGPCSWEGEQDRGLTLLEARTIHSF